MTRKDEMPEAMNAALKGLYQAWRDLPVDLLIKGQSRSDCLVRELFSHVKEVIIQYQRAASPPVPDDVAEALHCAAKAFDGYRFTSQEANKYMDALIAAHRATSTPSAEVKGLVAALTKIQTISAHMESKRSGELNKIASQALAPYQKDFL